MENNKQQNFDPKLLTKEQLIETKKILEKAIEHANIQFMLIQNNLMMLNQQISEANKLIADKETEKGN